MTVKEKITNFLYNKDNNNNNITPIIEFINNLLNLASAYNQMWTVETINTDDNISLMLIDDVTKDVKVRFENPDIIMQKVICEIDKIGWIAMKEKYLYSDAYNAAEQRVILINNNTYFSPIYSEI